MRTCIQGLGFKGGSHANPPPKTNAKIPYSTYRECYQNYSGVLVWPEPPPQIVHDFTSLEVQGMGFHWFIEFSGLGTRLPIYEYKDKDFRRTPES